MALRWVTLALALLWSGPGLAVERKDDLTAPVRDIRSEVPSVGLTYSAFGSAARVVGFTGIGRATSAEGGMLTGGGGYVFASPLNRLTIALGAERGLSGRSRPMASVLVRLAGSRQAGWAVAAIGNYKADGFGEIGGEAEFGTAFSLARHGWNLDANALLGVGFEEEETDAEFRLRVGYDLTSWMRLGIDEQVRVRMTGQKALAGNRTVDVDGGAQLVLGSSKFFGAITAGPSLFDVARGVGFAVMVTTGGAMAW